jgi:hypothetical protein
MRVLAYGDVPELSTKRGDGSDIGWAQSLVRRFATGLTNLTFSGAEAVECFPSGPGRVPECPTDLAFGDSGGSGPSFRLMSKPVLSWNPHICLIW